MNYAEFHEKFYNQNKQQIFAVGENLVGLIFNNQDLTGANFSTARLTNAQFVGANLTNVKFTEANLVDVDFSDANLQFARFNEAKLYDANFKGANLAHADMNGALLPYNWFQFTYYVDNDFDSVEIMTYDAENKKIIAFGLHEPMGIIRRYIEENKSKPENLGISIKNYDRMMVVVEFFEKLIAMNP